VHWALQCDDGDGDDKPVGRNFMKRLEMFAAIVAVVLLTPAWAWPGAFKVTPIKVFLEAKTKTTSFTITNEGEEPITVEIGAVSWGQGEKGEDRYDTTKDLVVFPKIVTLNKGEDRLIRVGNQSRAGGEREATYRIFVKELPVTKPGEIGLRMALQMSIPVFVAPLKEKKKHEILDSQLSEGKIAFTIRNDGNAHLQVGKILATGLDEGGAEVFSKEASGWYVLAGKSRRFVLDISREECLRAKRIRIEADVEKTKAQNTFEASKDRCPP
jgi:fimbrial chaperone protein